MKALSSLAALSVTLFLASCSLTQQQVKDAAADSPEAEKTEDTTGNPFSTRARKVDSEQESADKAAEEAKADTDLPAPTPEQQAAAERLMAEAAQPQEQQAYMPEGATESASHAVPPPSGGLRMGRIAPQEDPASVSAAPDPGANSVERHGLRSPKLPSGLPMNINGKLTGQR